MLVTKYGPLNFFQLIRVLFQENTPFEVKKEVAWCLGNSTSESKPHQIDELVKNGVLQAMLQYLQEPNIRNLTIVPVIIEGCSAIIWVKDNVENHFSGES